MRENMNFILCAVTFVLSFTVTAGALAQDFPNKPVHIIVPYSAGSGSDVVSRVLAVKLSEAWGQPVVVENREGAGGLIGAQAVLKAAPDGYTLLCAGIPWAVSPSLYAKPAYDPLRDFVAVGRVGFTPSVLVVSPTLPVKDVKELLQLARAKPGQINYSSSGKGSPSHLFMEYLKTMAKADIVEVPYKVTSQALTDVIGGQVMMNLPILVAGLPHIQAGRLKALAVTGATRAAAAPDIPTMAESAGLPGYEATQWIGLSWRPPARRRRWWRASTLSLTARCSSRTSGSASASSASISRRPRPSSSRRISSPTPASGTI